MAAVATVVVAAAFAVVFAAAPVASALPHGSGVCTTHWALGPVVRVDVGTVRDASDALLDARRTIVAPHPLHCPAAAGQSAVVPLYALDTTCAGDSAAVDVSACATLFLGGAVSARQQPDPVVISFRSALDHAVAMAMRDALTNSHIPAMVVHNPTQWGDAAADFESPATSAANLLGGRAYRLRPCVHVLLHPPPTLPLHVVQPDTDALLAGAPPAARGTSLAAVAALDVACRLAGAAAVRRGDGDVMAHPLAQAALAVAPDAGCMCTGTDCFHTWAVTGPPAAAAHVAATYPRFVWYVGHTASQPLAFPTAADLARGGRQPWQPRHVNASAVEQLVDAVTEARLVAAGASNVAPDAVVAEVWRRQALRHVVLDAGGRGALPVTVLDVWGPLTAGQSAAPAAQAFTIRLPFTAAAVYTALDAAAAAAGGGTGRRVLAAHAVAFSVPSTNDGAVLSWVWQGAGMWQEPPAEVQAAGAWLASSPAPSVDVVVLVSPLPVGACIGLPAVVAALQRAGVSFVAMSTHGLTPATLLAATHPHLATAVLLAPCTPDVPLDVALLRTLFANGRYVGVVGGEVVADEDLFHDVADYLFGQTVDALPAWLAAVATARRQDPAQAALRRHLQSVLPAAAANIPVHRMRRHARGDTDVLGGGPVFVAAGDPRPTRLKLLQAVVAARRVQRYLEIGCNDDSTFARLDVGVKVGVDPDQGGTHRMTSDAFFATLQHQPHSLQPPLPHGVWHGNSPTFDLVFVDGLHEYRQVLRDVDNALRVLAPGGVIVMHDCSPRDEHESAPERRTQYWNGDTWRAAVQLRSRPDVDMVTGNFDQGVAVLVHRHNTQPLPPDTAVAADMAFADFDARRRRLLRLMEWDDVLAWVNQLD